MRGIEPRSEQIHSQRLRDMSHSHVLMSTVGPLRSPRGTLPMRTSTRSCDYAATRYAITSRCDILMRRLPSQKRRGVHRETWLQILHSWVSTCFGYVDVPNSQLWKNNARLSLSYPRLSGIPEQSYLNYISSWYNMSSPVPWKASHDSTFLWLWPLLPHVRSSSFRSRLPHL